MRVRPETPIKEVARLLVEYRIGGVPVVDADGQDPRRNGHLHLPMRLRPPPN